MLRAYIVSLWIAEGTILVRAQNSAKVRVNVPGVGDLLCNKLIDGTVEGLGIPYAKAPIGQNRFRPPQHAEQTDSLQNVTAYGPACMQPGASMQFDTMSEDCLTLNVWSPSPHDHEVLPVFFWIQGGAFNEGSGREVNGSQLAKFGIVVVSINYRLGVFGWFTSMEIAEENPSAPGNGGVHGWLDQVAALRWVREHIFAFHGDRDQITIAGESAGALSVCTHLHLPVSKGLFKRAIIESGSCVAGSPWAAWWNATDLQKQSEIFMRNMNATDLASLRRVPASLMLQRASALGYLPQPSPDGWYMQRNPADLPVLSQGIDIIVGSNTMDSTILPPFSDSFTPKTAHAYASLVTGYFGAGILDLYPSPSASGSQEDVSKAFYRMNADVCATCPKHTAAQKFLEASANVYVYEFGFTTAPVGLACHSCEIANVFDYANHSRVEYVIPDLTRTVRASYTPQLGRAMSKYWASFVKSGTPYGNVSWPRYQGAVRTAQFLDIASGPDGVPLITVQRGVDADKCEFFDKFKKESSANMQTYYNFCGSPVPISTGATQAVIV